MDPFLFWLFLFGAVFAAILSRNATPVTTTATRLERKIDLLLKHLGIDPNEGVDDEILELVKSGQKIAAIKLYREKTGAGLREAKDFVESL